MDGGIINRQKAIDTVKSLCEKCDTGDISDYADMMVEALECLPSAQQKQGKWIRHTLKNANVPWGYDCSVCGEWFVISNDTAERYSYCPHCGHPMKVGEQE